MQRKIMKFKPNYLLLIVFMFLIQPLCSQSYSPAKENLEARKWFADAKFGLFIHWGVYSVLGDGEWVMQLQNISIPEYEKLPTFFNPVNYNAAEWVKMAKDAGMKYICITTRHHDGFSMFDTELTDYNIVKSSPYKKDILKELAVACEKEGIKLFFYYSLLDWHNDDYYPRGSTGNGIAGRKDGNWEKYIAFMKGQLTELLTNYGEIGGIWFDGDWDKKEADWHYDEIYQLIHRLQPQCLIGNNHHEAIKPGEDFQMFEKDLPGRSTQKFASKAEDIGSLPKEVCETINGSWGFNLQDRHHKSDKELIQYLIKAAGYGTNLLLNVGPMPNGKIQEEHVKSLEKIGDWLAVYGETIYGSEGGILAPSEDLVSTQKGKKLYVHLLNPKENWFLPGFNTKIENMTFFKSRAKVKYQFTDFGLLFSTPAREQDEIDTIIEITLK
ncbi:alpha-L-fucosidase [Namhaeicola litoreus]|uniref:alpha-L-fucosidase n=1 Tax=Namhaeicola litoreus TaxID=1052145 RepID=A0ABW3Y2Z3_9FLAO